MLKKDYHIMWGAAEFKVLILNKIIGEKDARIQQLERQLQANKKFPYLATALKSTARQVNQKA